MRNYSDTADCNRSTPDQAGASRSRKRGIAFRLLWLPRRSLTAEAVGAEKGAGGRPTWARRRRREAEADGIRRNASGGTREAGRADAIGGASPKSSESQCVDANRCRTFDMLSAVISRAARRRMTMSQMRLRQRRPDDRKHSCCITHHQRGFHAHHTIAKPPQRLVPSAVRHAAATMHATVHLDDQAD